MSSPKIHDDVFDPTTDPRHKPPAQPPGPDPDAPHPNDVDPVSPPLPDEPVVVQPGTAPTTGAAEQPD